MSSLFTETGIADLVMGLSPAMSPPFMLKKVADSIKALLGKENYQEGCAYHLICTARPSLKPALQFWANANGYKWDEQLADSFVQIEDQVVETI